MPIVALDRDVAHHAASHQKRGAEQQREFLQAAHIVMTPRLSYTLAPPSRFTLARPSAMISATIPSMRFLLADLSGFQLPAGSLRTKPFEPCQFKTGFEP